MRSGYKLLTVKISDASSLFPAVHARAYIVCDVSSKRELLQLAVHILENLKQQADVKALQQKDVHFSVWLYETKSKAANEGKWAARLQATNDAVPEIFFDDAPFN